MSVVDEVINFFGSQRKTAEAIDVSQPAVHKWVAGASRPSAKAALLIEEKTKGKITRHDLRPDVFGENKNVA